MNEILFVDRGTSLRPALAAAAAEKVKKQGRRVTAAAGTLVPPDRFLLQFLTKAGFDWPQNTWLIDDVDLASFDLVISFSGNTEFSVPSLPGNPPVIYWDVPEPRPKKGQNAEVDCRDTWDRIRQLVEDLFEQGYVTALVQVRKNAELVLDNLHEGVIAHDLKRRIFFFNKAAEMITGFSRQEIVGRDCHEVFPERFCRSKCSFCDLSAEPTLPEKPYSLVIRTREEQSRQIEMSVMAINNFLGNPVGVVASFRDVTREFELASRLGEVESFAGIIGRDPKMQEVFRHIRDLSNSNASVLIQGESGTGKELVAAAIHNEGRRAKKLFVPINCGALPEHLLESELFGHVKGAFTGAVRDKKGRFELADGGTIFLDEIGDVSAAMQVKLLRVLQDGTFQRVGGEETVAVDVRVISATNKDLQKEIEQGRFREDLYYRLCVVPLTMPPLRERRNDIPLLADYFVKRFAGEEEKPEIILSPDLMQHLLSYDWPGNVRELQNVIRYILVRCQNNLAKPQHLPANILEQFSHTVQVAASAKKAAKLNAPAVREALAATEGNRAQAARRLGVARATLYRFLEKNPNL